MKILIQSFWCLLLLGLPSLLSAQLSVSLDVTPPTCAGYGNGQIMANASGGVEPYTYGWSTGANTAMIFGISDGTYTVTVTDAAGAMATASGTIVEPAPLAGDITPDDICLGSNATVTANITGGTLPYTYSWAGGDAGTPFSGPSVTAPGRGYTGLTVTDANGCKFITGIGLKDPIDVTLEQVGTLNCDGSGDVSLNANVVNGFPGYTYLWSNGGTTTTIKHLDPGTYGFTVTDAQGCTATGSYTIEPESDLTATATATDAGCDEGGSATASATGGSGNYSYQWSTGADTPTIDDLAPGDYAVTVSDGTGCFRTETVTVNDGGDALTVTPVPGNNGGGTPGTVPLDCNGDTDGSIAVDVSGGSGNYSYVWSTGSNAATLDNLGAGSYGLTVTDAASGCTGTTTIVVSEPAAITLSFTTEEAGCNGGTDGSLTVTATGGTGGYTYDFGNGNQAGNSLDDLAAGSYPVTVTDANGCTASGTADVAEASGFTVDVSVTDASCDDSTDGSATVTSTTGTGVSYVFSDGQTGDTATNLPPGDYTLTAADTDGCETTVSFTVAAGQSPQASFDVSFGDCTGDMVEVTLTNTGGGSTFSYDVGGTIVDAANPTVSLPTGSTVDVTLTAANGVCEGTSTQTIDVPGIDVSVVPSVEFCAGDTESVTVVNNGGDNLTYDWSPDALIASGDGTPTVTFNGDVAGNQTATLTITNDIGCTQTETITVSVLDAGTPQDPALVSTSQCAGTTVDFTNDNTGGGGVVFDYPTGTVSTDDSFDYPAPGDYTVALLPATECGDTAFINLTVTAPPGIDFTFEANCDSPALVDFTAMGMNLGDDVTFAYDFGNGETSDEANPQISVAEPTTLDVTLTVFFGDGCELSVSQPVSVSPFSPAPPQQADLTACSGQENVELYPNADPNLDYSWSPADGVSDPNAPNPTANVNETTTYSVVITDPDTGCETTETVTLTVSELAVPDVSGAGDFCEAQTDLTLTADVDGAVTYDWYGDEFLTVLLFTGSSYTTDVDATTTFYVVATDANGCTSTTEITVNVNPVDVSVAASAAACAGESAPVDIVNNRPDQDLTIVWSPVDPTTEPLTEGGTFTYTATNEFGCSATGDVDITVNDPVADVTLTAAQDSIPTGGSTTITVEPFDPDATYTWSPADGIDDEDRNILTVSPETTTLFELEIEDENGCVGTRGLRIFVIDGVCEDEFFFPNAFTPNDDDNNDLLRVDGFSVQSAQYVIYDRWGELIFTSNGLDEQWDGTYEGKPVCNDVYGYYLTATCFNGTVIRRQGNVTVLR